MGFEKSSGNEIECPLARILKWVAILTMSSCYSIGEVLVLPPGRGLVCLINAVTGTVAAEARSMQKEDLPVASTKAKDAIDLTRGIF